MVCLLAGVLLVSLPALASPAEGFAGWISSVWESVFAIFAGSEEPEPEPAPQPVPDDGTDSTTTDCVPPECGTEGRPSLDPDG